MIEDTHPQTAYYPNKMGRVFIQTLKESLLLDGFDKLLHVSGLPQFSEKLPPDNWALAFDFNIISRLNFGVEKLYGPRGGRRLTKNAGQKFFDWGWGPDGELSSTANIALKARSLPDKLESGLQAIARQLSETSDQKTWIQRQERQIDYHVGLCPICWNRVVDQPICHYTVGFLQAAFRWFSTGSDFRVRQTSCRAVGESQCVFRIDLEPLKS